MEISEAIKMVGAWRMESNCKLRALIYLCEKDVAASFLSAGGGGGLGNILRPPAPAAAFPDEAAI